jgi:PAS domain S-box-containing protein
MVMEQNKPFYDIEYGIEKPDGTKLIVSVNAASLGEEQGETLGVVVSFTDITERKKQEKFIQDSRIYAESIVETVREPLIVLDWKLRVRTANPAFYQTFKVTREETEGKLIYELGNSQWDIERLRELLEEIIPRSTQIDDYEVEHIFPSIGYKIMLLNARKIYQFERESLILLAIEDITTRKQLERDLREGKTLSDALNKINDAISKTEDSGKIIKLAGEQARITLEGEVSAIIMLENDLWTVRHEHGLPEVRVGEQYTGAQLQITPFVKQQRTPVVIEDTYIDERVNHKDMMRLGIRSLIGVSLTVAGTMAGVLFIGYGSKKESFSNAEIDFVAKLGITLSLSLEAARVYQAERNISETLQNSILIIPDRMPGISFGHIYHSATETARVGGDFYDLFELEDNKVGIIIGDVSGKGLEAAALTTVVKNTIKAHAFENGTPATIVAKTNDLVERVSSPSVFVTLIFLVLDTRTGTLIYCNAGHPPAIIKRGSTVKLLEKLSPIIGAFKGLKYQDGEAAIEKDDALVLYTDGVIEARSNGEFYGEDRLINFTENLAPVSAKNIPQAIINNVNAFTGGKLTDDIAILALSLNEKMHQ